MALTLGRVYLSVLFNDWYRQFYNALEQRDLASFQYLLLYFCGLAAINVVVAVYRLYLTQMLEMRWRTWLTHRYLRSWLSDDVYYRLELENRGTDNPDQRIAEDLRNFTTGTLSLSLGLLSAVVTLASFVVILWNVGGPLTFTLGETEVTIPGFMVWMALVYAIVGTILTHYVGRRLIGINFMQERFEADFRFSLVRLRENAEGVALYRGERAEEAHLRRRFGAIQDKLVGADALHQAADVLHRRLQPDGRHLPVPGQRTPLLRRRDSRSAAAPDQSGVRPGRGQPLLVHQRLRHAWRTGRRAWTACSRSTTRWSGSRPKSTRNDGVRIQSHDTQPACAPRG